MKYKGFRLEGKERIRSGRKGKTGTVKLRKLRERKRYDEETKRDSITRIIYKKMFSSRSNF